MANASIAIPKVIKEEAGFQKDPADTGNYYKGKLIGTKYGITPASYFGYYKQVPTQDTIKNLTVAQATPIYKRDYWDKIKGDGIANASVADLMMLIVVNSGPGLVKSIKHVANETAGKKIFAETTIAFTAEEIKILNTLPQQTFFNNLKTFRERFYNATVVKEPNKKKFLKGWLDRLSKHTFKSDGSLNPSTDNSGNLITGVLVALGLFLLFK